MESIGEKLTHRREEKNFSIDQVARETHIAKRFIEALESEAFDRFPGESYLIGFLRNYSEFLELDADEIISLYRNTQMQEQPSPMDELLVPRKKFPIVPVLTVVVVAAIIGGGVFLLNKINLQNPGKKIVDGPAVQEQSMVHEVVFSEEIIEQEFQADTAIIVPLNGQDYRIEIRNIGSPLMLYVNDKSFPLEKGQSGFVDLNQDNNPDLRIIYKNTLENGNPVLRFDKVIAGAAARQTAAGTPEDEGTIALGHTTESSRQRSVQTLSSDLPEGAFLVEAIFRGPELFRYVDENGQRVEHFYNSGERFQLDIQNYAYFWISNAGKVQMSVAGQSVRLGTDGETAAFKIARVENNLELIPMY